MAPWRELWLAARRHGGSCGWRHGGNCEWRHGGSSRRHSGGSQRRELLWALHLRILCAGVMMGGAMKTTSYQLVCESWALSMLQSFMCRRLSLMLS